MAPHVPKSSFVHHNLLIAIRKFRKASNIILRFLTMMFDMVLDTPLITVRIFIYLNACVKYAGCLVYFRSIKNKHEKDKKSAHAQNANLITINSMLKETLSANDSLR